MGVAEAPRDQRIDEQIEWLEVAGQAIAGSQWLRALARHIGMAPRTVGYWYEGRVMMTPDRWYLIAEALERSARAARDQAVAITEGLSEHEKLGVETFCETAEQIHGPSWRIAVAEDMGVSRRWVGYCAAGERPVRRGHFLTLAERLQERADEREAIARIIRTQTRH